VPSDVPYVASEDAPYASHSHAVFTGLAYGDADVVVAIRPGLRSDRIANHLFEVERLDWTLGT
jgi:hypothetical protein